MQTAAAYGIWLAVYIPTAVIAVIGWRLGRAVAFRRLTWRWALIAIGSALAVAMVFWAPDLARFEASEAGLGARVLVAILQAGIVAMIVMMFTAVLSWAFNLDDFWAARRKGQTDGMDVNE